ncbi:MAG: molybdenum cofactor biosynthesis protein MoaE [Pseudomonadales bacterium]
MGSVRIQVQEGSFDVAQELDALLQRAPGAGAVASFIGRVRGGQSPVSTSDPHIGWLELEHYPGMTEKSIERIAQQATKRFELLATTVIHRVGRLAPGESIVLVLTASRHRKAAFDACEFVMDYLKLDAIFWKRERRGEVVVRIESTDADRARARSWERS